MLALSPRPWVQVNAIATANAEQGGRGRGWRTREARLPLIHRLETEAWQDRTSKPQEPRPRPDAGRCAGFDRVFEVSAKRRRKTPGVSGFRDRGRRPWGRTLAGGPDAGSARLGFDRTISKPAAPKPQPRTASGADSRDRTYTRSHLIQQAPGTLRPDAGWWVSPLSRAEGSSLICT